MIRKLVAPLAAAALSFGATAVVAAVPVVNVGDAIRFADGPGASPGGAFVLTAYSGSSTTVTGSFQSFCLEKDETMNYTGLFTVAGITNTANAGGVNTNGGDVLSLQTEWLYKQFMESAGALGTTWNALSAVNQGTAMQQAIWLLEGEITSTSNTTANNLIGLANTAVTAGWTDIGDRVRVLNINYASGALAQDQLYIMPVPEPESYALLLAGLGLMGLIVRRRRSA